MSNIIKFPGANPNSEFIGRDIQKALNGLAPETAAVIKEIIEGTVSKYREACNEISFDLPPETTDAQLDGVKKTIGQQRSMIFELVSELISEKIRNELRK